MKTLPAIALLLAACQTTQIPSPEELDQQLRTRALAFAVAMEAADTDVGMRYAAPSAKGFFEANQIIQSMQWDEEERRPPADVTLKSSSIEGDHGVVVVTMTRGDEGRDLALHFELENYVWGAVGFCADGSDQVNLFAEREERLRDVIARAKAESTPHEAAGPIVKDYLAAGSKKDMAGMAANMTAECKKKEERETSFTSGFLAGRFKVKRWEFARHEVEGDTVTQNVRTQLELADGEIDTEPMRFSLEKTATGWVITGIR